MGGREGKTEVKRSRAAGGEVKTQAGSAHPWLVKTKCLAFVLISVGNDWRFEIEDGLFSLLAVNGKSLLVLQVGGPLPGPRGALV